MINVCIYCGNNKSLALQECESCLRTPSSHHDVIHSIVACFSDSEPYLNFLSLEEVEGIRECVRAGHAIRVNPEVFSRAEEAYSAVKLNDGPKAIQYLSTISFPIMFVIALIILAMMFI